MQLLLISTSNNFLIASIAANFINIYNFINIGEYKITELNSYSVYNIKRKTVRTLEKKEKIGNKSYINDRQLNGFKNFKQNNKNNKSIILVDDEEEDVTFTYKIFFREL